MNDLITLEKKYTNLYDVFPIFEKPEVKEMVAETRAFFDSNEKEIFSNDEFAFVLALNKYIRVFEKAKMMILKDKFTAEYKGSGDQVLRIEDFEILPVKKT